MLRGLPLNYNFGGVHFVRSAGCGIIAAYRSPCSTTRATGEPGATCGKSPLATALRLIASSFTAA